MFNKNICGLLFVLIVILVSGCYSVEEVQKEKLEDKDIITEVILPGGESIKFNDEGGRIFYKQSQIEGNGLDSLVLRLIVKNIKELRTKLYTVDSSQLDGKKITEVTWENKKQYIFDDKGGYYDASYGLIKGNDIEKGDVSLFLKDISSVYISKPDTVSMETLKRDSTIRIKQVLYENNIVRTFNDEGGRYLPSGYFIVGITADENKAEINLEDVLYAKVKKTDAAMTTLAVLGGCLGAGAVVFAIVLATKESCPFVYSFDGRKFIFDAEPLGGATSIGLKRGEFSRLEFLKEVDGRYQLKVVNEVDETQYIDEMNLYVVDHPANTEAVMNNDGKVYLTSGVQSFISASDENGSSLSKFLLKEDGVNWQTKMPVRPQDKPAYTRNQLNFSFKRPAEVDSINLVINAGTSLWGSNMIKEMLMLYGSGVDEWYKKIDQKSSEYYQMMSFLQREELYELKLYLKEKSGWTEKTIIQGAGPFITERRIIPLDISQTEGDTLFLRVNPPCGFWSFDYIAIEKRDMSQTIGTDVTVSTAIDYTGADISRIINKSDENYYEMPETGNSFQMEFEAPSLPTDMVRTVFLKSSGYYKIHFPKDKEADYTKLYEIGMVPGSIVSWSFDKYIEWWNTFSTGEVSR